MVIDGESHKLEILDTSGLDDYADLEDKWISTSEAFVLVYDISSISSFKRIPRYYNKVQRALKPTRSPNSQIPMILVGNKCDKYSGREVSIKDGELLAQYLGCEFVETSAKNDINVAKAFCDVTKQRQQYTQSYAMDLERGQKGEGIYPQGVRKVIISEQDIESNAHKTWWQGWWLCNCLGWE